MPKPLGSGWRGTSTRRSLEDLLREDEDLAKRMIRLDRQTTELTLDLERIDHEVKRCYQARMALQPQIEAEKLRSLATV